MLFDDFFQRYQHNVIIMRCNKFTIIRTSIGNFNALLEIIINYCLAVAGMPVFKQSRVRWWEIHGPRDEERTREIPFPADNTTRTSTRRTGGRATKSRCLEVSRQRAFAGKTRVLDRHECYPCPLAEPRDRLHHD